MHCNTGLISSIRLVTHGERSEEKLVGREGFEPSTNGLKVHCSTD